MTRSRHHLFFHFVFVALHATLYATLCTTLLALTGCSSGYRSDLDYEFTVKQEWQLEDFNNRILVQFDSVFWEPDDSLSLRKMIVDDAICSGRDVLEIGTGTGLIAINCVLNGADKVIATDINLAAVANAKYNAAMLAEQMPIEVRTVSKSEPGAFAVIKPSEKFDLIISNPPWEDGAIKQPADHAFYDPSFELMDSLLNGLPKHLRPSGRCLMAYGHVPAIERLLRESERRGYAVKILDDRKLDDLQKDFLPGMLVEIRLPNQFGQRTSVSDSNGVGSETPSDQSDDSAPSDENK